MKPVAPTGSNPRERLKSTFWVILLACAVAYRELRMWVGSETCGSGLFDVGLGVRDVGHQEWYDFSVLPTGRYGQGLVSTSS
ncbi:hypothetical protein PanWU01x14_182130 [Parasponia andersonii]|uniref:Uncharacterized protein n=1 Tax=Parasponia andersonii TaxID=3476 RepID=A0A2P5C5M2_PARAD|nr:hypothetical protein PanWU01x14_182130 [Parasponia andersonii]